jgi:hypothetical protein
MPTDQVTLPACAVPMAPVKAAAATSKAGMGFFHINTISSL